MPRKAGVIIREHHKKAYGTDIALNPDGKHLRGSHRAALPPRRLASSAFGATAIESSPRLSRREPVMSPTTMIAC